MLKKAINGMRRVVSAVITVLLLILFVLVIAQKVTGEIPGILGYRLMYVLTGSMSPELEAGDAILVRETEASELCVGDVICYRSTSGETEGLLITHKVVKAPYEQDGVLMLQTQGVANSRADDPIAADQVVGKVLRKISLLGKFYQFFCTVPGLIAIVLPILFMMGMEIKGMVTCIKEDIAEAEDQAKKEKRV